MRFLVAHPGVLAGLIAFAFTFMVGASIGSSIAKHSTTPVRWFSATLTSAVVVGLVVAYLLTGGV